MAKRSKAATNNLVVFSDLHAGCRVALITRAALRAPLDEGVRYVPSSMQRKIGRFWNDFLDEWLPRVTKGEKYDLAVNGDSMNGKPHDSIGNISDNPVDQIAIAQAILQPVIDRPEVERVYIIRGTEAHVGKSGHMEEALARQLGPKIIPNKQGQYARYELWKRVGPALCHLTHHIGTTSSTAFESTALMAELAAEFNAAGRWGLEPPDVVIRSHRHRYAEVRVPSALGNAIVATTPGWQAKTPFVYRMASGRVEPPQFGGLLIRHSRDEGAYCLHKVYNIGRPSVEE